MSRAQELIELIENMQTKEPVRTDEAFATKLKTKAVKFWSTVEEVIPNDEGYVLMGQ